MTVRLRGAAVLLAAGVAAWPGGRGLSAQQPVPTAVVCLPAAPATLEPMVSPDLIASDLRMLLYTPLVLYDGGTGVRPYLATRWQWSADQRELRLDIRTDVHWHDGRPLTAEDVAFTLRAAADPARLQGSRLPLDIDSVAVTGPGSLRVRFHSPQAAGLEPLATLPVLPAHLLAQVPPAEFARAPFNRAPVGSGPYRFVQWRADGSLELERSAAFPAALGRPAIQRLLLRVTPEPATAAAQLETGEADACLGGAPLFQQVRRGSGLTVLPVPPTVVQAIPLNTTHPPLDDARVRRALSAALDRRQIAAAASPLARPARSMLPQGSRWLDAAAGEPDAEPRLAAALLDSAGWSRRAPDGIRRNARGEPLRIQLLGPPSQQAPLTVVQAQLRRAGVDVELRTMEGGAYISTILNKATRPDAMALGYSPDRVLFPDYTDQLASSSGRNLSGYSSQAADTILYRLRGLLPERERAALYRDLQQLVARSVPTIYTVFVPRLLLVTPRLTGVRVDPNGPFESVSSWRLARP